MIWRNEGALLFTELFNLLPALPLRPLSPAVVAGDLDNDGDEDLWVGGQSQIHWNVRRQLAWRNWPRVGKPLTMELYGSPDALWGLWASFATASIPTNYGLLRVDFSQGARVGVGYLDSEGRAEKTVLIPNDLSLIGALIYWQAAIGKPVRLSNLEITELSDA